MPYYEDKLERVKFILPDEVCKMIRGYKRSGYLQFEAQDPHELFDVYSRVFKEEFGEYITPTVEEKLVLAATAVGHLVVAHLNLNLDQNIDECLKLVKAFVERQIDDFGNWCDEVVLRMPIPDEELMETECVNHEE
jgi:hypothetical protein